MIEAAYRTGEALGVAVWTEDNSAAPHPGPFQTMPYPGASWVPTGEPVRQAHEYIREGTAKLLTLFHPASGQVRVKGVTSCTNLVLHAWLKEELTAILATLPTANGRLSGAENRTVWDGWQADLTVRVTLPAVLPPLRMLLVWDNLTGHQTPDLLRWLFAHGIMPLWTPLGASWLNMTESVQGILERRALVGQHPTTPQQIIDWLEATAQAWNREPTPFEWGGRRAARRARSRQRRHRQGGSGAWTRRPIRRRAPIAQEWLHVSQSTH